MEKLLSTNEKISKQLFDGKRAGQMNSQTKNFRLDDLIFDNRFIRELPADPETANNRRQVFGSCYSRVLPAKVANPQMVAYSREVAELLDLSEEVCASAEFTEVFAGNSLLPGMVPYAT